MNTNFNRSRSQLFCESSINCSSQEEWNKSNFKALILSKSQAEILERELREDAKDLYFKGLLSLFEGLKSVKSKLFSWATIKIYYSIFYFLKCTMAVNGIAIIRNKSLFYLKAVEGEMPITIGNKKYNSDHSGVINYFIKLLNSDILLSQSIDSTNAYDWLMKKREQIHYRERKFNEPGCSSFWETIAEQIDEGKLEKILIDYIKDNFVLCFQEEHAILGIPLKRAILTKAELDSENVNIDLSKEQKHLLINLLPIKIPDLLKLTENISNDIIE